MPPPSSRLQRGTGRSPYSCLPERYKGAIRPRGHIRSPMACEWGHVASSHCSAGTTQGGDKSPLHYQELSRGGHPPCTFSGCPKGHFLGPSPPGEMMLWAQALGQVPGGVCVCPSLPSPCPPHHSQHHVCEQADKPIHSSRRGNNTQSCQSS